MPSLALTAGVLLQNNTQYLSGPKNGLVLLQMADEPAMYLDTAASYGCQAKPLQYGLS
jgi:hypothetical protein